ncbi:hypothetical protein ABB37_00711 [Leptomonas pyrrhocoris]|uniref:Uncharacterized protein n=1 Tax=Leptomonas pyrrhocoris TaxID=157538 RepID=A0A0N0VHV5_LEPPY|nr:hypothetical protein ABB37_00711 [Leptomonas pyrrhocoris]KPA86581.1 hypothetical protein ABB37_00711 [Leptomonas pyrrhocoris]|eukprot:XP_015665020.1 hypothetical protein ABB37_00711 [Leptomonas pyrrhocoris]
MENTRVITRKTPEAQGSFNESHYRGHVSARPKATTGPAAKSSAGMGTAGRGTQTRKNAHRPGTQARQGQAHPPFHRRGVRCASNQPS